MSVVKLSDATDRAEHWSPSDMAEVFLEKSKNAKKAVIVYVDGDDMIYTIQAGVHSDYEGAGMLMHAETMLTDPNRGE